MPGCSQVGDDEVLPLRVLLRVLLLPHARQCSAAAVGAGAAACLAAWQRGSRASCGSGQQQLVSSRQPRTQLLRALLIAPGRHGQLPGLLVRLLLLLRCCTAPELQGCQAGAHVLVLHRSRPHVCSKGSDKWHW
jgi:hypothetical protein